jgi:ABC-type antimicrobial peptide transport system permease subunit
VLLAGAGIFGLTARMVVARRRELGIRAALGAQRAQITRTVMSSEARALAVGIVTGLALAAGAVRGLESFLFGIVPLDLSTFVAAALALGAVGLVASYLPARWLAERDPIEVLRAD